MPSSNRVPTNYTGRWRVDSPQSAARGPDATGPDLPPVSAAQKYNTSCNSCREARVKCSGGIPCQRCAANDDMSMCAYSVSRRRGKRKASDGPHPELGAGSEATTGLDPLDITSLGLDTAALDQMVLHGWPGPHEIPWPGSGTGADSVGALECPRDNRR